MALKAFSKDGIASTQDAVDALYYAVVNGADIVSAALGGTHGC